MAAAGAWRLSVLTRHFALVLVAAEGGNLAGSMTEQGKSRILPLWDVHESGARVEWKVDVPGYSETAEFKGRIDGDRMSGRVQAGLFAPAFRARRIKSAGAF